MNETHNPAVKIVTDIMESIAPGLRSNRPAGAHRLTTDPTGYMVLDDRPVRVGDYVCVWFGDRWMTVEVMPPEYGMDTHFALRIPTVLGTSLVRMDVPDDAWFRWPPKHDRGGHIQSGGRCCVPVEEYNWRQIEEDERLDAFREERRLSRELGEQ